MIKAVVFDFDGTLADTIHITFRAIGKLSEEILHRKLTKADYERLRNESLLRILQEEHIPLYRVPYFVRRIKTMTEEEAKRAGVFPGVKSMLNELSRKYTLGILTSSPRENVVAVLKRSGIDCISFIFSGSSLFGKEVVIRRMLKDQKYKSEEVVYVGDEVRDVVACRKAKVRVIAVRWGFNSKRRLVAEKPDDVADSPKEIGVILRKIENL